MAHTPFRMFFADCPPYPNLQALISCMTIIGKEMRPKILYTMVVLILFVGLWPLYILPGCSREVNGRIDIKHEKNDMLDDGVFRTYGKPGGTVSDVRTTTLSDGTLLVGATVMPAAEDTVAASVLLLRVDREGETVWQTELNGNEPRLVNLEVLPGDTSLIVVSNEIPTALGGERESHIITVSPDGERLSSFTAGTNLGIDDVLQVFARSSTHLVLLGSKPSDTDDVPVNIHVDREGNVISKPWDLPVNCVWQLNDGRLLGAHQERAPDGTVLSLRLFAFNPENGERYWSSLAWDHVLRNELQGFAELPSGDLLLSLFDSKTYRPVLVQISHDGNYVWSKHPRELSGYRCYGLVRFTETRFLLLGEKSHDAPKGDGAWISPLAFLIDESGEILSSDYIPDIRMRPNGGAYMIQDRRIAISGTGYSSGESEKQDLALYMFDIEHEQQD